MIMVQDQELWRTDHHIEGYEVSNTGKVRSITGKPLAIHGTGAKSFVKLVDRRGRQRQRNVWQLVRMIWGHNPVYIEAETDAVAAKPETDAVETIEPSEVRWVDLLEDDVKLGYRISDLGEVISPSGQTLQGGMVRSQTGDSRFDRRVVTLIRVADSEYLGGKQMRLDLLVARHFLPAPEPGHDDVEHINGDPADCRAVNLRWAPRPGVTRRAAPIRNKRAIDVMVRRMATKMAGLDDWAMVITPRVAHRKYWVSREGVIVGVQGRELTTFRYEDDHVGVHVKSSQSGRSTTVRLDQLILEAFGRQRPSARHRVVHRNGDPLDCTLDNLCWSTTDKPQDDPHPGPPVQDDPPATPTPVPTGVDDEVQVSILARYSYAGISVLVTDDEIVEVPSTTLENAGALAKILDRIAQDRQ